MGSRIILIGHEENIPSGDIPSYKIFDVNDYPLFLSCLNRESAVALRIPT